MDAWIKLLVQERQINITVPCAAAGAEGEVKEEKARSGHLTLYLINQSERWRWWAGGGGGKAASATFGSEEGWRCNHF